MSEQTRIVALQTALALLGNTGAEASDLVETAGKFDAFLSGVDSPAAAPAAPAKPAKTAKPAKPAKTTEPTEEPEAPADEAEETPSEQAVKDVISGLIGLGQRDALVNLLKKFKATSFSGIKAADYAKFVIEGEQIAANAKLAQ